MSGETPSQPTPPPAAPALSQRLARGYALLCLVTTGLVTLGALVRANGAGLACPDWPLCFGEAIPEFDVKIGFEVGHRYLASLVSLGFAGLAALAWRNAASWRIGRPWILVGGLLLVVQVILGALTVWELLASWTVTSHLLTGNAFNAVLACTAARYASAGIALPRIAVGTRALVAACLALLVLQMALGGLVSSNYAGLTCPEWPACIDGVWFPGFDGARAYHLAHRLGAYSLVALLTVAALATRGTGPLGRLMVTAMALGIAQAGVGIANVLLRLPVEVTGLHSLLAALLVLVCAVATFVAWGAPEARAAGSLDPSSSSN